MPEPRLRTFTVLPKLPDRLQGLRKIAYNLWWTWHHEAVHLFKRIDPEKFEALDHSPHRLFAAIDQARLDALAQDDGFLSHLDRVEAALDLYMKSPGWYPHTHRQSGLAVAYFSMEFGIHECVPVYSGGLGVLAGDHLKSASDLGLPLCGVSLMYRQGYFRQYLNSDGWQQERYPENDFFNMPLISENNADGIPLVVGVPFPNREVLARVWRIQVGRVPLYLLDTNLPQNQPADREITAQLYGGDQEMRVKQELILGIGGYRALRALGKQPTVCHMNEGHSAFLVLERIRSLMDEKGLSFAEAQEAITASTVFTTHTPVPAGNDAFAPQLIEQYLGHYASLLGIEKNQLLGLGRINPAESGEFFGMTVLALKTSNVANGVSKLHGSVSRKMWRKLWPDLPEQDVPICSVSNGVHLASWTSAEMTHLLERYLGTAFWEKATDARLWQKVDNLPDAELWRCHERNREQLIAFARQRLRAQLKSRGASVAELEKADDALDPEALTIGFARRFATYKRGTLIFRQVERLAQLVARKDRPVQLIFAGKAHPHDKGGKEVIQQLIQFSRRPELRRRIVFIEDYDIHVARMLVHGADVWLNNPRRPLEASGTSGMKVVTNGGLHLSILDGWWAEGYAGDNGFAIGAGEEYTDLDYQDEVESHALYEVLEHQIVPLFYERGEDGVPRDWLRMVKQSIKSLAPVFNTNRMVEEYLRLGYEPSFARCQKLLTEGLKPLRQFAAWKQNVAKHWPNVSVDAVETTNTDRINVGAEINVKARVQLAGLAPEEVRVEIYHGTVDSRGFLEQPKATPMKMIQKLEFGAYIYEGSFPTERTGHYGLTVRVLPDHPLQATPFSTGLIHCG